MAKMAVAPAALYCVILDLFETILFDLFAKGDPSHLHIVVSCSTT